MQIRGDFFDRPRDRVIYSLTANRKNGGIRNANGGWGALETLPYARGIGNYAIEFFVPVLIMPGKLSNDYLEIRFEEIICRSVSA